MLRKSLLGLVVATAITGSILSAAPTITSTSSTEERTEGTEKTTESSVAEEKRGPIAIDLLTDIPADVEIAPGEEVFANVRIRNAGTDPAHIFVEVTDPVAVGAELADGSRDPHVVEFEVGTGWMEIEDGVYFYQEILSAGEETTPLIESCSIPDYNLTIEGDEMMTGSISMSEVEELLSDFNIQGYSIMDTKGTPEQLWRMVGGE